MLNSRTMLLAAVVSLLMVLGGCAQNSAVKLAKDARAAAEVREEATRERMARANEEVDAFLKSVPDWVAEPPQGDGTFVWGVGSGRSGRHDLALKKARLTAEFELAKQVRQALSGSERLYQRDGANGQTQERYTLLIDKLVDRVNLVGHEVSKSVTVASGSQFQTWVLMRLSFDAMEKMLAVQRSGSEDSSINQLFEDLDRRLREYREQQRAAAVVPTMASAAAPSPARQIAPAPSSPEPSPETVMR